MNKLLAAALVGVSVIAVAASAYAWRARNIAINAWAEQARVAEIANSTQSAAKWAEVYQDAFRAQITANAGIKPGDSDRVIAEKLTQHLYEATLFSSAEAPFATSGNNPLVYLQTINHEVANMCATLSSTLVWALNLFDIPARPIDVASEAFFTDPKGPTHTFIEVKAEGQIIAFDPTFNATYSCDGEGEPLDARAMTECVQSGRTLTWNYLGPTRPGRSIEEYPDPLEAHFFAVDASANSSEFYEFEKPHSGWLAEVREDHASLASMN